MPIPIPQLQNFDIAPALSAYVTGTQMRQQQEDRQAAMEREAEQSIYRAAELADTPEKWAQLVTGLQERFPDADLSSFTDFASRDMAIGLSMDPYQRAQLDLARQDQALRQQAFAADQARANRPGPRQIMEDPNGIPRYVDTGEPVFPGVEGPGPAYGPIVTGAEAAAQGLDPSLPWQLEADGEWHQVGGGGVNVNLPGEPVFGPVQPGFARVPDVTSPTGFRLVAEPGGAPERDAATVDAAAANRVAGEQQAAGIILDNIDTALNLANQPMTTGVDGAAAALIPGTPAYDLRATVDTIKANIGFAQLNEMRQSSPTGAALGAITERELAFLQAVWGNLNPNQSHGLVVQNLNEARRITEAIVGGQMTVNEQGQTVPRQQGAIPAPTTAATPAPVVTPAATTQVQTPLAAGAAGTQQNPARITTDAQFNALPSGAYFVGPDGQLRRKP